MNKKNSTYMWIAVAALAALLLAFGRPLHKTSNSTTFVIESKSSPDSIDPAMAATFQALQLDITVYDGLVTYKKSAGTVGSELVPDLATAVPKPQDGGKTWTFTMRTGIKFAPPVNREVQPSDLKWSFERMLQMASAGSPFYAGIVGAVPYEQRVAKHQPLGDVTGIVADDAHHTITFHLLKPDGSFLNKLALGYGAAVPKGTKAVDLSNSGFAVGTGPYMYKQYVAQKSILLVRNPNFHQWTPDTPRGFPDKMLLQIGNTASNAITLIENGQADYSQDPVPAASLPALQSDSRFKQYLHESPSAETSYLFLNTEAPPFDNKLVRQAINFAIDRSAMLKLEAGTGTVTETILPPNMPGYKSHHLYPYDLAKAKALIKQSGIKPGHVNIWSVKSSTSEQYLQDVLDSLGFTADIKVVDQSSFYVLVGNRSQKAQIGFGLWGQDYPDGSDFMDPLLYGGTLQPTNNSNFSFYKGADKQIEAADNEVDPKKRAAMFGALDKRIMQDAPWVPYLHRDDTAFVSKRVSNFIDSPVFNVLLDQIKLDGSDSKDGAS